MQSEQEWMDSELSEREDALRQFRWTVSSGLQEKIFQEWVRAKRTHSRGIDEALVTAHFTTDGRLVLERYALPCGRPEWIECDDASFEGYVEEGEPGLIRGVHKVSNTTCSCGKRIHRSQLRAQAFSRTVAEKAGTHTRQREYNCDWSVRAFHLSSKRDGRPIPGAYVVLPEGWNS